jgi:signal transduction histidine kinase/ActR/RegA family two-component response regulator
VEVLLSKVINNDKPILEVSQFGGSISLGEFAPRTAWSEMGESEHFAQFYETEASLLDSLSGFIGVGLGAGDACVVVATEEHREGLNARLQMYDLDLAAARASGRYVSLDAAETLSKFTVDGVLDPELFAERIGEIMSRAAESGRRVRVYGEMVALLWAEGDHDAAIRLEGLWNALRESRSFSLFCGYPMSGFGGEAFAEPLSRVCAGHSRVIPAESYTALNDPDERLRAILSLQQKATALEAEIAERKQAEAALRAVKDELEAQVRERERLLVREQIARAEAENASHLKDEFLATVSHELRTPLTAIIGWTHMLRSDGLDKAAKTRALQVIERNAKALAQLVEDILDVSRVITGKLRLNVEAVDAAAVINAAIDSVQLAAETKGIQLGVTLDPSARHIAGDASRLQQVVWNLLSNAIKFSPSGGRVEVRLERADSGVQISVSDTGDGISPAFLPYIFDRFRQADGTSTRRHGGLGLGLSIVRHLVELHGGTVHAESAGEGCGATFTIHLPLPVASESAKRRRRDIGARPNKDDHGDLKPLASLNGLRVLLVDDDQDTLAMLATALTQSQATVQTASSAAEALEVLQWYQPDVLVSDLAMPVEDGYTLIEKVRALKLENGKPTPALALTAYARIEDRARALSAGFNMFVPKPVEPSELITAIANLTEINAPDFVRV